MSASGSITTPNNINAGTYSIGGKPTFSTNSSSDLIITTPNGVQYKFGGNGTFYAPGALNVAGNIEGAGNVMKSDRLYAIQSTQQGTDAGAKPGQYLDLYTGVPSTRPFVDDNGGRFKFVPQ